mgnify:CR=1 FL=1
MRIGVLSKQADVSRDTIRLYERMGLLIDISQPHEWNNYKEYGTANLRRLSMIKSLKQLGFTLIEWRLILELIDNNEVDEHTRRAHVMDKIAEVDAKIAQLNHTKALLLDYAEIAECSGYHTCMPGPSM